MSLFHKKSAWERALDPALHLVKKGGKPILGIVGVAVAATAASAAVSIACRSARSTMRSWATASIG